MSAKFDLLDRAAIKGLAYANGWDNPLAEDKTCLELGSCLHKATLRLFPCPSGIQAAFSDQRIADALLLRGYLDTQGCVCFGEASEAAAKFFRAASDLANGTPVSQLKPNPAMPKELLPVLEKLAGEPNACEVFRTEALREVLGRVGQNIFRNKLDEYWQGQCAVTCLKLSEALRASHIKPWADCMNDKERLDVYNGLLLSANLDALFDKGLITFDETGQMQISPQVSETDRTILGISGQPMKLRKFAPEHQKYLEYHRDKIFQAQVR